MSSKVGCVAVVIASCAGCCCLRVPTFGLWPEIDEASARQRIHDRPALVQKLCRFDEVCAVVEGADVDVVPVGYNPLTGTVVSLVAVEATCRPTVEPQQVAEIVVCAGVVAAVGREVAGAWTTEFVTSDTLWGVDMDDPLSPPGSSSGDWDWD